MPADVKDLIDEMVSAWGCWAPSVDPEARRVAYVSDRRGTPELWVGTVDGSGRAEVVPVSHDPVLAVRWSPDGEWLACSVATGGGVRSEVWVLRPDGSDRRRLAGSPEHAVLGSWARRGHRLAVTVRDDQAGTNRSLLFDPTAGSGEEIVAGSLVEVLDLSADERFALVRDGTRGAHVCELLDRNSGTVHEVLPHPGTGSTDRGLLRPPPSGEAAALIAYVVTDAGQAWPALVAVPVGADGGRAEAGAVAHRDGAELELVDADDEGTRMLLAWNVEGRTELEVLDTTTGTRRGFDDLPGLVVTGVAMARHGGRAVLAVEDPSSPSRLWELDLDSGRWRPLSPGGPGHHRCVVPTLERLESHDGLVITGWLYRPRDRPSARPLDGAGRSLDATGRPLDRSAGVTDRPPGRPSGATPGPAVVSIHGGPESQERPVFNPQHQVLVAAGIVVFAPNIRGSSGFGRAFVHADDRFGRLDAIADVAACASWLVDQGLADPHRVAVSGRSYGGYVTLMCLTLYPELFTAGVDICGMSDLTTFFRDSEPWIAEAAVTKYGDRQHDAMLLANLSPLRHVDRIQVPLLVVHGELDTNVPVTEARQVVAALEGLQRDVEYLEMVGEGHEYRRVSSRRLLLQAVTRFLTRTLIAHRTPQGASGPVVQA
ncbi:MAG TPA: prolyl oligopeptidase family serine peptidase [Acidimicrobiales bacterium]